MSNAIEIVRGEAKCYLLLYECYISLISSLLVLSLVKVHWHPYLFSSVSRQPLYLTWAAI